MKIKLIHVASSYKMGLTNQKTQLAHFSDHGRLFQADRGRRFSAIVDAQGMRASEGLNVSQVDFGGADLSRASDGACDVPADAVGKSCWHSDAGIYWSFFVSRSVAPLRSRR